MKTIGLIGGMSWESTVSYYQIINDKVKEKLGGLHSAKILLYSVDFAEVEKEMSAGNWDKVAEIISSAAVNLEKAGADCILICTNTVHKVAGEVKKSISVPLFHMVDCVSEVLIRKKIRKVALLGTRFTMTEDFYKGRIIDRGIDVMIPSEKDVSVVDDIIFKELCLGIIKPESKKAYLRIIDELAAKGAEAVIFGCTEIGLLLDSKECSIPAFDSTVIHASAAAEFGVK